MVNVLPTARWGELQSHLEVGYEDLAVSFSFGSWPKSMPCISAKRLLSGDCHRPLSIGNSQDQLTTPVHEGKMRNCCLARCHASVIRQHTQTWGQLLREISDAYAGYICWERPCIKDSKQGLGWESSTKVRCLSNCKGSLREAKLCWRPHRTSCRSAEARCQDSERLTRFTNVPAALLISWAMGPTVTPGMRSKFKILMSSEFAV